MPFTDKSLKKKRKKNIFIKHLYLKNYKAFQNNNILLLAKREMLKDKNKVRDNKQVLSNLIQLPIHSIPYRSRNRNRKYISSFIT